MYRDSIGDRRESACNPLGSTRLHQDDSRWHSRRKQGHAADQPAHDHLLYYYSAEQSYAREERLHHFQNEVFRGYSGDQDVDEDNQERDIEPEIARRALRLR
jgi:hypothetical protein